MGSASVAFDGAVGDSFASRILESIKDGRQYAGDVCNPVRGNSDPALLSALREIFQFFLKGAISLHRKGRQRSFWEKSSQSEAEQNFCAQLIQLTAVVSIAHFLEETGLHNRIDWQIIASHIPSEVRPDKSVSIRTAQRYASGFAHMEKPDKILKQALFLVLSEKGTVEESLEALNRGWFEGGGKPSNPPEPAGHHSGPSVLSGLAA